MFSKTKIKKANKLLHSFFGLVLFSAMLGIKPRAMLGKQSTTELYPQAHIIA
jgi:hypothetical protein